MNGDELTTLETRHRLLCDEHEDLKARVEALEDRLRMREVTPTYRPTEVAELQHKAVEEALKRLDRKPPALCVCGKVALYEVQHKHHTSPQMACRVCQQKLIASQSISMSAPLYW